MRKEKEIIQQFLNFESNDGIAEVPLYSTKNNKKQSLYAIDPYYREGFENASVVFGEDLEDISLRLSAMIFKPDAIVGRKVNETIAFLIEKGFTPIAFKTFSYNRNIIREDWRYQYNIATRNRMRAVDCLLQTSPSLIVFFITTIKQHTNACEEMTSLKGHSDPKYRTPDDLRSRLKSINPLLNYIHTCDEPADLYRSLGLYFNEEERKPLLKDIKMRKDATAHLNNAVLELYNTYEEIQFNYEETVSTLRSKLEKFSADQQKHLKEIFENPMSISQKKWELMYHILVVQSPNILSKWEINILLTSSVKISIDNKKAIIN